MNYRLYRVEKDVRRDSLHYYHSILVIFVVKYTDIQSSCTTFGKVSFYYSKKKTIKEQQKNVWNPKPCCMFFCIVFVTYM